MRLYLPDAPSGFSLPSQFTQAVYPIVDVPGSGYKVWMSQIQDSLQIPLYYLRTTPPDVRGTLNFSGSVNVTAPATTRDFGFKQLCVFGIPLASAGTVPHTWVFANAFFGTSCYATMDYGSSPIRGLGFYPMFIYIYRPSTQTVVSWIAYPLSGKWFSQVTTGGVNYVRPSGAGGTGPGMQWSAIVSDAQKSVDWYRANGTAQAGDILCYEMWGCSYTQTTSGIMSWSLAVDVGWNGAVSTDQAWTTSSNVAHTGNSFFYWDDISAPAGVTLPGPVPTATPCTLLDVSPKNDGVDLTFDNEVLISPSLTLGTPAAGLRALGASSNTDLIKKLNIKPIPPSVNLGF